MTKKTASDILIETLTDWGVEYVFGIPGDGINGIMEALRTHQDKIRFVQTRHEEAAAFMACGYAKYTNKLGVCLGTSGPGGIHLLNGLYDAKLDQQPVLALTGMQYSDVLETHTQQDVDLDKLFMDVAVYNTRVMNAQHVRSVADLACRTALAYRGVSHLSFPVDVQEQTLDDKKHTRRNVPGHSTDVVGEPANLPSQDDLRRAADVLNSGKKIAIIAGRGALHATEELERVAELLGAPVVTALLGKACLADDSPYLVGTMGLLGTTPSQEALESCDTVLMIGTSMPYIEFLPKPDQARGVQIDSNPIRIGLRFPVEAALIGDSRRTLRMLIPLLERNPYRKFLKKAQDGMKVWKALMQERESRMDMPMKPQVVAAEIGRQISDTALVACDSGTIATWWARHIPVKRGQKHALSGTLATMACGLSYANAAQMAYPDRQVIAFVGDGGFTMLMGEFATAVKYKLPIKVFVIKNNTLGQIKWEQMVMLGNPEFACDLQPIDFAAFAQACGGTGYTLTDPKECAGLVDRALHTPGPVLVEAVVDPFEPPMPPKVSVKQAARFAESLARGTPNRDKIIASVTEDRIRELV